MRCTLTIFVSLALIFVIPEMAAMTHIQIGGRAFSLAQLLRSSMAFLVRVFSAAPQPVWLVLVGILCIVLSLWVRYRASRSASQGSR